MKTVSHFEQNFSPFWCITFYLEFFLYRSFLYNFIKYNPTDDSRQARKKPTCLELLIIRCILDFFARVAYRYHSHGTVTDSLNSSLGSNHDNLQLHDPLKRQTLTRNKVGKLSFPPEHCSLTNKASSTRRRNIPFLSFLFLSFPF